MKKRHFLCKILALLLLLQCFAWPVAAAPEDETTAPTDPMAEPADPGSDASVLLGSHSLDARVPLKGSLPCEGNMQSAILYEMNSDTLVYAYQPDTPMAPASLVKVMTALLAVERGTLDDKVTVTEAVLSTVPKGAMSVKLQAGEVISLRDLLYCLLVGSANDAASVIADHISGSQAAFVEAMNQRARELGCTGTNFVNPHGLNAEAQKITARDMAKILKAALPLADFQTVFSTVTYIVPATNLSEERKLSTGNYLMNTSNMAIYYDSRVTGGRTGIDESGLRCLAAVAESEDACYISVVLGAKSVINETDKTVKTYGSYQETIDMLDLGFTDNAVVQIFGEGRTLTQYPVPGGANNVAVSPNRSVSCVLPVSLKPEDLSWRYQDIPGVMTVPVEKGKVVSVLQVWYGNICIAQSELISMNGSDTLSVMPAQAVSQQKTNHPPLWKTFLLVLGVLLAMVGGFAAVLYAIRRARISAMRAKSRRRRRNRRRSR